MTDEPPPDEPPTDEPPPPIEPPPGTAITLTPAGSLLSTSFDLLLASTRDTRRASFYIGAIVLGTVGPVVLAELARQAIIKDLRATAYEEMLTATVAPFALLTTLAVSGLFVAAIESRTMAASVLGANMAGRPLTTRMALTRGRSTFWRAIVAWIVVAFPVGVAQGVVSTLVDPMLGMATEATVITSTLVSAVVGAPFAYVLAGVVLGDVDPFEATRRSFRLFKARKLAASLVAVFETITVLLLVVGLVTGLDVAFRLFDALGLGSQSSAVGLALTSAGLIALVFAFGTLIFLVMAITIAPQVVMFVGLTHATFGLDRVRRGGPDDPDIRRAGKPRFLWFSRFMLLGFVAGGLALALAVSTLSG